ncbi:hypothetical protein [Corynebacterium guangdongense]|uniref:DoxX family membrane protein n=1 Tax=Corynebacterium guangdongense TaxID=1783348 RepID=A0ABU1ZX12_9CORY|nr:hypothetical protein [Corynebacterium guangdongense]MDR7328767.1 hypothetical protein [Corynebacterium guangdongense]WJZ17343.1 hypothetical protein CGUA_03740 [Corynebacterium guangdongense]
MSVIATAALRIIPGLFIANSGIGKIGMPAEMSTGIQEAAASGIPALKNLPAEKFGTYLGYAETALGAALLAPVVPNWVAGAGLTAFGSGLLTMYFSNPENTEEDGIRPSYEGISLAKDSWLVAMGVALLADGLADKSAKEAKKEAKQAQKEAKKLIRQNS